MTDDMQKKQVECGLLRIALERIFGAVPTYGDGGFFTEHCDEVGNPIGQEFHDPVSIIQHMQRIARDAIDATDYLARTATPQPVQPAVPAVVYIQPDHLQKALRAPHMSRVEPTQRMPDFVPLYAAAQPVQPSDDAAELAISDAAVEHMSKILDQISLTVNGPELSLHRRGYHDLAEKVSALQLELYRHQAAKQVQPAVDSGLCQVCWHPVTPIAAIAQPVRIAVPSCPYCAVPVLYECVQCGAGNYPKA